MNLASILFAAFDKADIRFDTTAVYAPDAAGTSGSALPVDTVDLSIATTFLVSARNNLEGSVNDMQHLDLLA